MALLTRLPFRSKTKLSKYESALEDAFAQKTLYTVASDEVSTLSYVPHYVVIQDVVNTSTAVTLPTAAVDEGKVCVVISNDTTADSPTVGGVTIANAATTVIRFDGSNWVKLYTHANA